MSAPTVLIADDSLVIRAVVRDGLESDGYRVVEAVDGLAAVERCREDRPDVVLLDIEMPGLDGYQVLAELKGDAELRDIPVVFLTGRNTMDDVVAGLRGGAHDYLKKPFEGPELLARVAAASHVKKLQDQLQQRNAELERLSRTDALTGLYNRRYLDQELTRYHGDSIRYQYPLSVALLDLDHFKQVNDTYGHSAGDQVLRVFAEHLHRELRAGDVGGRWGGEEFLLVLPHTDLAGAVAVADRIRAATAAELVAVDGRSITVTVSGGCALALGESPEAVVQLADAGLYRAKLGGRNQIATAAPATPRAP
ncbi:diguanylate cyclase [Promicromonospora sp. NPDC057138]|uniref:diguanylate cyclase n=1 Tax=Promicromonospora sp. NPDC057138 TaxID=3346031 RepID=UPI00363DAB31